MIRRSLKIWLSGVITECLQKQTKQTEKAINDATNNLERNITTHFNLIEQGNVIGEARLCSFPQIGHFIECESENGNFTFKVEIVFYDQLGLNGRLIGQKA